ncbi:MAG TPA: hypothetical protein VEK10_05500 [Steroidobacteraceae bacterium]|nr:hypothetical protein [Steroidobacteraceae bacterium]
MQLARSAGVTRTTTASLALILCALPLALARGQQLPPPTSGAAPAAAPAREIPRPDELEPGVNTSALTAPAAASAPVAPERPSAGASSTRSAPGAKSAPAASSASGASAAHTPSQAAPAAADPAAAKTPGRKGADRLQLDATEITGNRELPKVLYIVPWKHSDLGDLSGKPINSLVDEVLQPLDRDVFQRENRYYDALSPPANAPKPGAVPSSGNKP